MGKFLANVLAALAVATVLPSGPAFASDDEKAVVNQFAVRYAAAWCSQNPASVAAFFAEDGSLTINDGTPSVGRAAITEAAESFMTAYPDMVVEVARLDPFGTSIDFTGTSPGRTPVSGGTGRKVRISGYEEWTLGADGLVAKSLGHYDAADWNRQLGKTVAKL